MRRFKIPSKEFLIVFLGWLLLGVMILLFSRGMSDNVGYWTFTKLYFKNFLPFLLILYFNSLVLLPKLYYNNKRIWYFVATTIIAVAIVFYFKPFDGMTRRIREITRNDWEKTNQFNQQDSRMFREFDRRFENRDFPPDRPPRNGPMIGPPPMMRIDMEHRKPDLVSFLIYLFLLGVGLALESSKRLTLSEKRRLQAESEKSKAELSFLKAQVNPHFLFNTLNNIYSMSLVQKKETPDAIMKLSNIMRYITETSEVELKALDEELDFISDYIFLNKLKGGSKLELSYELIGESFGKQIPPLLLISFIENAFKYGISKREISPIDIKIDVTDNNLEMYVKNKIFINNNELQERTGIGIENTKKRLDTIFPGRYKLDITSAEESFTVHLIIPLITLPNYDED